MTADVQNIFSGINLKKKWNVHTPETLVVMEQIKRPNLCTKMCGVYKMNDLTQFLTILLYILIIKWFVLILSYSHHYTNVLIHMCFYTTFKFITSNLRMLI